MLLKLEMVDGAVVLTLPSTATTAPSTISSCNTLQIPVFNVAKIRDDRGRCGRLVLASTATTAPSTISSYNTVNTL